MTTAEVAGQLVSLCQKGQFKEAIESLYSPEVTSLEACEMPEMPNTPRMPREMHGLEAARKKAQWWEDNHTVHATTATGPFVAADKFAVVFSMDATFKPTGQRHTMKEVAVYTVKNGKIPHVEFLFQQ